jgi:GMC oxidoreductase
VLSHNNALIFLFHRKRIRKNFENHDSLGSLASHLNLARGPIKIGYIIGLASLWCFESKSKKIPFLKEAVKAIDVLYAMHDTRSAQIQFDKCPSCECSALSSLKHASWDDIVIGSGPGGAVSAYYAAKNGKQTLIIESGFNALENDLHHGADQLIRSFKDGGQELIYGLNLIPFAQGACLGGGSQINSGLYHRLPNFVRNEWLKRLNIDLQLWEREERFCETMLKVEVQSTDSLGLYADSPLVLMARNLGLECRLIPRWRKYQKGNFDHWGMRETYLSEAKSMGLNVLTGHKVERILNSSRGSKLVVLGDNCRHLIYGKNIVVSAGPVESPRLLVRSKLVKRKFLKFNFHAMTRIVAEFPNNVNDLRDIDPHQAWTRDFSAKFGAAVATEELLAATLASYSVSRNLDSSKLGVFYTSTIPSGKNGFFKLFTNIYPYFILDKKTKKLIAKNADILKTGLLRAGALSIVSNTSKMPLSTVHIFGSLPLNDRRIFDAHGYLLRSKSNVRVCDASIFPTAPFVNPQGPLVHLAGILGRKFYE